MFLILELSLSRFLRSICCLKKSRCGCAGFPDKNEFFCEHGCGYEGEYQDVLEHEKTCKHKQKGSGKGKRSSKGKSKRSSKRKNLTEKKYKKLIQQKKKGKLSKKNKKILDRTLKKKLCKCIKGVRYSNRSNNKKFKKSKKKIMENF